PQEPRTPLGDSMQRPREATRICGGPTVDHLARDGAGCVCGGLAAPVASVLDQTVRELAGGFSDTNGPEENLAVRLQSPKPVPLRRDERSGTALAHPDALLTSGRVDGALTLQCDEIVGPCQQSRTAMTPKQTNQVRITTVLSCVFVPCV